MRALVLRARSCSRACSPVSKRFQLRCRERRRSPARRRSPRRRRGPGRGSSLPRLPPRAYGKTTPRIISQRVVPSASAPSFRSARDAEEELARDARDDRQDHDRQHDDRGEDVEPLCVAGPKSGMKPSAAVEGRLDVVAQDRRRGRGCPRARSRRSGIAASVSTSAVDRAAQPARCELGEEEGDCRSRAARR